LRWHPGEKQNLADAGIRGITVEMNLIFRLLIVLLRARNRRPLDLSGVSRVAMRVLPNDLDLNLHLNNGRYLTIMDLGRIDFILRSGLLRSFLKNKWMPLIGGTLIRYRFSLRPFEKFDVVTKVVGWDDKWFYFEQKLETGAGAAAIALAKGLVQEGSRTVNPAEVLRAIGVYCPAPPYTEAVARWLSAEQTLHQEDHPDKILPSNPQRSPEGDRN
jgi:acyl-CoA thioesterase FadM